MSVRRWIDGWRRCAASGTRPALAIGALAALAVGACGPNEEAQTIAPAVSSRAGGTSSAAGATHGATTGEPPPGVLGANGSGEAGAASASPPFVECAEERGLRFTWRSGHADRFLNPEIVGGGVALIDCDGDGDLDVFFVQGGDLSTSEGAPRDRRGTDGGPAREPRRAADGLPLGADRLFRNDGTAHFADVTIEAGLGDGRYGMGAATGDYDNDGDVDLYVTNLGRNTLLRNDGGRFADVTDAAGVGDPAWSTGAAFLDFDADGDLDLYVANYMHWSPAIERDCKAAWDEPDYCGPSAYRAPAADTLYRNRGDGTFEDATAELGIDTALGNGLGVTFGDFDGDGRCEIFVANDAMMNHLWVPFVIPSAEGATGRAAPGTMRFRDVALARGVATDEAGQVKAGMGVGNADVDGDGDLDLLVVNLQRETDSLFRNDGAYFVDRTAATRLSGLSRAFTRFGTGFLDVDNDGRLDLYEANGRVQMHERSRGAADPYAEPNLLYRGVGGLATAGAPPRTPSIFAEWLPRGGTSPMLVHTSRGAAFGDLDNDGGIDIVVVNRDAPAYLLLNAVRERGHWLLLRVLDEHGRDALGATVTVRLGDLRIRRDVLSAYSYCAANDPRVHVGLGDREAVDGVDVRWVDGTVEAFPAPPIDRVTTLSRGGGSVPSPRRP